VAGVPPRTLLWEAYSAPPDPYLDYGKPNSKEQKREREGNYVGAASISEGG